MNGPWIDTVTGKMWTPAPGGRPFRPAWGPSIRNDALWHAKTAEREAFVQLALAWRDAAIADGWQAEPTYEHESIDRAWRLRRDGYQVQGISRAGTEKELPTATVHIWGPDKLAIEPPLEYDMAAITRGAETCSKCAAHPVQTERVGFAGRYCGECAPAARKVVETPGWAE